VRIQGLIAAGVLAALALSGCTPTSFAFLREEMSSDDVVSADIAEATGLDPETVRHQGGWEGHQLFLAVVREGPLDGVQLVIVPDDDPSLWSSAGTSGDHWFETEGPFGGAKYLPDGVGDPPDGWVALSEWVMVRD
jgi:hypothetical protein